MSACLTIPNDQTKGKLAFQTASPPVDCLVLALGARTEFTGQNIIN